MHRFHPSRREFLKSTAVVGAATFAVPGFVNADGHSVVRIRARTDIKSLDTARAITTADFDVRQAVLNNLILYKPGNVWTWTHDAAEHIEQVDPLHTEFRLRPGIMWTNGYGEMTAEDVKYSYERMLSPELEATDRQEYEALQEVKVIDKYSGVIVMKKPVANLWTNTLPRGMGAIICKKAWEEQNGWTTPLGNNLPCSSGPYKVKDWQPQTKVVLDRNELWNGPKPHFDQVEFVVIEDDNAAEVAYLAGELDVCWASVGAGAQFRDNPPENTDVVIRPTTGFAWIGINVEHEPFDDIRVRQAVRLAIDMDQVIEAGYFGLPPKSGGVLAPGVLGSQGSARCPSATSRRRSACSRRRDSEAGSRPPWCRSTTPRWWTPARWCRRISPRSASRSRSSPPIPAPTGRSGSSRKAIRGRTSRWSTRSGPPLPTRGARRSGSCATRSASGTGSAGAASATASSTTSPGRRRILEKRGKLYEEMMDDMWDSAAFLNVTHPVRVVLVRDHIDPQMLPNGYVYFRTRLRAKA